MPSSWNLPAIGRANRRRNREETSLLSTVAEGGPRRREGDNWLERWLDTCADLARLKTSHPMLDAVIDEIDGRNIRVGDQWLADFASCYYLKVDVDPEIMGSID